MRTIVKNIFYTLFINLALLAPAFAQAQANMAVEKLEIIVPTHSEESCDQAIRTIRSRLKTKIGNLFCQAEFDTDLKMLIQDYDRIEPHVEVTDGRVCIQIKIWE